MYILYPIFPEKQDLVSEPGSCCGNQLMFHRHLFVVRFTILTFAVGGTLISMVVVGFLINATCHVHGVCSAPCLQGCLLNDALINMQQPCPTDPHRKSSKSCHFSCQSICNFRRFRSFQITNHQALSREIQVRTAFTYAALISAVDPVAAG